MAKARMDGSGPGRNIMNAHDHQSYMAGCFRCDLSREEAPSAAEAEVERLQARVAELEGFVRTVVDASEFDFTPWTLHEWACETHEQARVLLPEVTP